MCLRVLNIPEDLNPKIATEDIPCYKLLLYDQTTNRYETPYRNFPIDFGYKNPYYMSVNKMIGQYYAESKDFVKFLLMPNYNEKALYVKEDLKWIDGKHIQHIPEIKDVIYKTLDIYAGIHAYLNPNVLIGCDQILFKAVIPKGAHYFIGMHNDIVADKMMIFDERVYESIKNTIKD